MGVDYVIPGFEKACSIVLTMSIPVHQKFSIILKINTELLKYFQTYQHRVKDNTYKFNVKST